MNFLAFQCSKCGKDFSLTEADKGVFYRESFAGCKEIQLICPDCNKEYESRWTIAEAKFYIEIINDLAKELAHITYADGRQDKVYFCMNGDTMHIQGTSYLPEFAYVQLVKLFKGDVA